MIYLIAKFAISAVIVVAVSELAKRSALAGAILASVPVVSVLAMTWLHVDTKDAERVASFSAEIVWLVLPSLVLFVVLPLLLSYGVGFWWSLGAGVGATVVAYLAAIQIMSWLRPG